MSERVSRSGAPAPKVGIVHLGLGAFFRAHGALYTTDVDGAGEWGILGVSLRRPDQRDRLAPQGFAYTAVEMRPEGPEARHVEQVVGVLVAPEEPEAVLAAMADPAVRVVTLTVTEKGYGHRPSDGSLDRANADITHDIMNPREPRSAPGFLVEALHRRREAGVPPFTVLSCDNLPDNGRTARGVAVALARENDVALADWIEAQVPFPSSMVDRIVPATSEDDLATVERLTGCHDASPVMHEPFRQWVVEDRFAHGCPAWERAGAQMVADVAPFEAMKLRCLNGTHSALAYLGYLAGQETIAETVAAPGFEGLLRRLWSEEIVPSLEPPEGTDLGAYTVELLGRYRNPAIRHRTWQIAMDGSQKLPQRILGTVADNLADGRPIEGLALAVAAWIAYASGRDERGKAIDVRDPLAERLAGIASRHDDPAARAVAFLEVAEVFPPGLAANERFRDAVREAATGLARDGAAARVLAYAEGGA